MNTRVIDGLNLNDTKLTRYLKQDIKDFLGTYYRLKYEDVEENRREVIDEYYAHKNENLNYYLEFSNYEKRLYKVHKIKLLEHLTLQELLDPNCLNDLREDTYFQRRSFLTAATKEEDPYVKDWIYLELKGFDIEDSYFQGAEAFGYCAGKGIKFLVTLLMLRVDQMQDTRALDALDNIFHHREHDEIFPKICTSLGEQFDNKFMSDNFLFVLQHSIKQQKYYFYDAYRLIHQDFYNDIRSIVPFISEYQFMLHNYFDQTKVNLLKSGQLILNPDPFAKFSGQEVKTIIDIDAYLADYQTDKHYAELYTHIKNLAVHNYHVNAKDGYANLREKANTEAKIITKVPDGAYVCEYISAKYDEDNEDSKTPSSWLKVCYPKYNANGDLVHRFKGFIHKSQLAEK